MGCGISRSAKIASPIEDRDMGKQHSKQALSVSTSEPGVSTAGGGISGGASVAPGAAAPRNSVWSPPAKVEQKRFREAKKGFQGFRALMQEESDTYVYSNVLIYEL